MLDVGGDWDIASGISFDTRYVEMGFDDQDSDDKLAGYELPFLARTVDGKLRLFFIIGDPDSRDWLEFDKSD